MTERAIVAGDIGRQCQGPAGLQARRSQALDGPAETPSGAERWEAANTLAEYGECTIAWLQGAIEYQPLYLGPVDVDEAQAPGLTRTLIDLNTLGYVTTSSQAGAVCTGPDGVCWAQVAAVTGFATKRTYKWVHDALNDTAFCVVASPVRRQAGDQPYRPVAVTWRDRVAITWFGVVGDSREVPIDAELALTVLDPRPGPNDLWAALRAAAVRQLGN